MKEKLKGMIIGILMTTVIVCGMAYAKQMSETAELFYKNIKIELNGRQVNPKDGNGNVIEPFIINGTTYLPVRGIASALGIKVEWNSETNTVILKSNETIEQADGYGKSSVSKDVELIKTYRWKTGNYNYVAFVIKNVSDKAISPRIQVVFKKADGTTVGVENQEESVLGAGNSMVFVCSNDEDFDTYEYVLSSSEKVYYNDAVSNIETKVTTTEKKAVIQIKNNGTKSAMFVEYVILFKKGNDVVGYYSGYCVDNDSEIKPQMIEMREASAYKEFDNSEIYVVARSEK